jgi:hypothetical protein
LDGLRRTSRGPRLREREEPPDSEEEVATVASCEDRPINGVCSWGGVGRLGETRGKGKREETRRED